MDSRFRGKDVTFASFRPQPPPRAIASTCPAARTQNDAHAERRGDRRDPSFGQCLKPLLGVRFAGRRRFLVPLPRLLVILRYPVA